MANLTSEVQFQWAAIQARQISKVFLQTAYIFSNQKVFTIAAAFSKKDKCFENKRFSSEFTFDGLTFKQSCVSSEFAFVIFNNKTLSDDDFSAQLS